jgi:hypothetical protein
MMYVTNSDRLLLNPLFRNTTYLDFLTYLSIVNQIKVVGVPCGICGGQSDTGTGFSPSSSVFPCQ